MKKAFCDRCGSDTPHAGFIYYKEPIGEKEKGSWGASQPYISVSITFSFTNRADGFGGPPDLCESCQQDLLRRVLMPGNRTGERG